MPASRASLLAILVLASALAQAPPGAAQGTPTPIVTDPAGDQVVSSGTLVTSPPAFGNVDVLAVAASQPDDGTLVLTVSFSAPVATASQNVTLNLTVERSPASLPASTADGRTHVVRYRAGTVTGPTGATAAASGDELAFTIPLDAIGAVGGDRIANVSVVSEDHNGGSAPAPVTQDDSSGRDRAPDSGGGAPYVLQRPPIVGDLELAPLAVAADPPVATTAAVANETTVTAPNATVSFRLRVTNRGLDPDSVTLTFTGQSPQADVSLQPTSMDLGPGEAADATLRIQLRDAPAGRLAFAVEAHSENQGHARIAFAVVVEIQEAAEPREPVPAALSFLSPLVTAVGLDRVFGAYAELAFLLFVLLLLVVGAYLLLFLVRTPWVRIRVTPRKAIVAPGGVAEFQVEVAGRRRNPALARTTLRTEGRWTSGLQVGRSAARPGESVDLPLEAGEATEPHDAVLRVQVPYDAAAKDRQELELDVVPVDDEGQSHPQHGGRAKVTVEAAAPAMGKYASAQDIRLAEVRHDPPDPRPGAAVRTISTIHNEGPVVARLRVVLQKDGATVADETVDVPPHDSRQVALAWTAGAGRNLVKVQVFLA